jgi:hypothetical protein
MIEIQKLATGLLIVARYPHPTASAEHDSVYASCSRKLEPADANELERLGWGWNEEVDAWEFYT